ncbi:segregation and condensation protein A [Adhaeretor mobilis]|uniref:Segregation and condensation protein A n=1 Tax=Adhaeretor mobilis TaxID=1930276 RepID=A0A517MR86_9BACT|nr:segregation/condensation protein A [Adhaeretor mobilis]QDS97391.1 Segregation and condensation protein A [Adhaeretor mobilis]
MASPTNTAARFRIQLDLFAGPFDLLLYLVRKHELDVLEIPIAVVTEQYLEILAVLEHIDVDAVGDFLEVATKLMEAKSQSMLPRHEGEVETLEEPRDDLVQQLLEYKRFKQAASELEARSHQWQLRYTRRVNDLEANAADPAEQPIQDVELWDLVSAFSRVMQHNTKTKPAKISYDETPIEVYVERIEKRLQSEPRICFVDFFEPGMHRSQLVGLFLAILELIRHRGVRCQQEELFGELWVLAAESKQEASSKLEG